MLRLDNTETRRMVEMCYKTHKTVLNPIIDWDDSEVWEFINEYKIPYCKLYDQGHKRLGCVGCPMAQRRREELEKYPKFKTLYMIAFEKMLKEMVGETRSWKTADDVMEWWLGERKKETDQIEWENIE